MYHSLAKKTIFRTSKIADSMTLYDKMLLASKSLSTTGHPWGVYSAPNSQLAISNQNPG